MNNIETRIKNIVAAYLDVAQADVKPEASFDDLGADSLDEIEIVMAVEDEFGIAISDDDANKIKTVQQAIDYVTGRVPA